MSAEPCLMRRGALAALCAAGLALQGCATRPAPDAAQPPIPLLRLPPAALGCAVSAQQRLDVDAPGRARRSVDVLLEADGQAVRLALLALGQTLARLQWDGARLTQSSARWAPQELPGERVLSELQMAGWPLPAVQRALPAGWRMAATGHGRELLHGGVVRLRIGYGADRTWTLENPQQGYRLAIRTLAHDAQPAGAAPGPLCF